MPVWDTLPHQIPSLRRLPAGPLLRSSPSNHEFALPLGWQRNPRLINRSGNQCLHVGMRHVRRSALVDEHGDSGILPDDGAGGTSVVEVNVRQKQMRDVA